MDEKSLILSRVWKEFDLILMSVVFLLYFCLSDIVHYIKTISNIRLYGAAFHLPYLIVPLLFLYILFKRTRITTSSLNLRIPHNEMEQIWFGLHTVFVVFGFYYFYKLAVLLAIYIFPLDEHPFLYSMDYRGQWRYFAILFDALTAGIFEEIFFRGILILLLLRCGLSLVITCLVAALAFSFFHIGWGIQNVCATFLLGLFLNYYYLKIRLLLPFIVAHSITDLLLGLFR